MESRFAANYFLEPYIYSFHSDFCDIFENGCETRMSCLLLKPLYSMRKFNKQRKFEQIDREKEQEKSKMNKQIQNKKTVKGIHKFFKEKRERNLAIGRKGKTHRKRHLKR